MKILIAENLQEEVVRHYLDAFSVCDVTRMLELVHPAVHYERAVDGVLETILNGRSEYEAHISKSCQFDERTMSLIRMKSDKDITEIEFSVTRRELSSQQLKGNAVFWFSEGKIIQLLIRVDSV